MITYSVQLLLKAVLLSTTGVVFGVARGPVHAERHFTNNSWPVRLRGIDVMSDQWREHYPPSQSLVERTLSDDEDSDCPASCAACYEPSTKKCHTGSGHTGAKKCVAHGFWKPGSHIWCPDRTLSRPFVSRIHWAADPRFCLDVSAGGTANGNVILLWGCFPRSGSKTRKHHDIGNQMFVLKPGNADAQIHWATHPEKCFDVSGGRAAGKRLGTGSILGIWDCKDQGERSRIDQEFIMPPAGVPGPIYWKSTTPGQPHICLDNSDGNAQEGNHILLKDCVEGDPNQMFQHYATATTASSTTTTAATPTTPSGDCVRQEDCSINEWCHDHVYIDWCQTQWSHDPPHCPTPQCTMVAVSCLNTPKNTRQC